MANIIVAFAKPEEGKSIRGILMRNGMQVTAVCTSCAQVLSSLEELSNGIIITGYRLQDGVYQSILENMPDSFHILLLAYPAKLPGRQPEHVVFLPMPLSVHDLIHTVNMMQQTMSRMRKKQRLQPVERTGEDRELIEKAKRLLMERNQMTESEAHRYLQKSSMDSGTNLVETAQMVISLIQD